MKISIRTIKNFLLCAFLILFLAFTGNYPNGRINIMLLLLLCLVGISLIAFKGKLQINSLYTIPLLYFLYFLSDVSNGISSSSDIVNLVICIALIVTFVQYIFNKSDTYTVIRIVFFVFLIAGPIIGIYQMVTGGFIFPETEASVYYNYKIFNSQQSNENYSALTMIIPVFLSLYLFSQSKKQTVKIFLVISALVSFVCLLLTFSRGAILGAAIALLVLIYSLSKYNKEIFKEITLGKIVFVIASLIAIVVLYSHAEKFVNSFDVRNLLEKKTYGSLEARIIQWKSIVTIMSNSGLKNLFLGYGSNYPNIVGSISGYYISAHNIFFGHLIQNGIIGCICLISLFVNSIKKSIEILKTDDLGGKFIAALVVTMWVAYQFVSMVRWELWFSIIVLELYYSSKYKSFESYSLKDSHYTCYAQSKNDFGGTV